MRSLSINSQKNSYLVYAILKSKKRFEALRTFTLESGQQEIDRQNQLRKQNSSSQDALNSPLSPSTEDIRTLSGATSPLSYIPEESGPFTIGDDDSDEEGNTHDTPSQSSRSHRRSRTPSIASSMEENVPLQTRGMSEKARGKMPAGQLSFSRQNSMTSISSHGATIQTSASYFKPTTAWIESWLINFPLHTILTIISAISPHVPEASLQSSTNPEARTLIANLPTFVEEPDLRALLSEPSPICVQSFEWSALALGWYESLLWGFIFSSEMLVGSAAGSTPGTVGVWNGTSIKLFKVQEIASQGPSLLAPKGAVDAVGSNLVQRIGNLSLRARSAAQQTQTQGNAAQSPSVREV